MRWQTIGNTFILLGALAVSLPTSASPPPIYYCNLALDGDPILQPIRDKVVLSGLSDPPFSMMANDDYATPSERQAILLWGSKRERCVKDNPPDASPISQVADEGFSAVQALILDLYKGQMTYGQFARKRQEVDAITRARIQQIIGQYQQQQSQQQRYQQQQEEFLYQSCMNRARNQIDRASCGMERAGRGAGRLFIGK